jgi:hypothetical protein
LSGLTTNSCIDKSTIIAKRVLLAKVDLVCFFFPRKMRFIEGDYCSNLQRHVRTQTRKKEKEKRKREREPLSDKDYPWSVRPSSEVTKEKKAAKSEEEMRPPRLFHTRRMMPIPLLRRPACPPRWVATFDCQDCAYNPRPPRKPADSFLGSSASASFSAAGAAAASS